MAEHIQIGDVAPRVQYVADGTQSAFVYPFPIFAPGDLEVRLDGVRRGGGFSVQDPGRSGGGWVQFEQPPPSGTVLTLRRRLRISRTTDYQPNGVLRANTLNDELDRSIAALQEVAEDAAVSLRLDPAEVGGRTLLPLRRARAGRILGFDASGDVTVFDRDSASVRGPFVGAVPRTVEDKMAERLSARDFGAAGDGATDDGPALQSAMNAAAAAGKHLEIGEGTYRTTWPLFLPGPAAGLTMRGAILYAGPNGKPALTIGDGGATRNDNKLYEGLRVLRAAQSDWSNYDDIGIVARNLGSSYLEIRQVEGFTIGARTMGDGRGFADSTVTLGRIVNNRIGLDVHTATAAAWNTSVRYFGGLFACSSALFPDQDRFGVRFSAAPGAYVAHNRHVFDSPNFQLQGKDRPHASIPFLIEVNSRAVIARQMRMEACGDAVARHTAGAQDHLYEVAWASQGFKVHIEYTASATRCGSVVRAAHQALGHREASREVAAVPSLRAAAIRWSATEWGFERLACLSTNVTGAPTTLPQLVFPGLDGFAVNSRGVVLNGGRGLGFVVDTRHCREFALAVDGDDPRLVVQCFDGAMNLLTDASGVLVKASGQSMTWAAGPRWWQGTADMTDTGLTRLQTVRLAQGVAFAVIGVARVDRDYELRALRLSCDPAEAPAVLYGLPDLPHGRRELTADMAWDPPSLAAGATTQVTVPLPGARPGDFASVAFGAAVSGILFLAQVGVTDGVTVTAWNRGSGTIDIGPGTLRARVVKT